MKQNFCNDELQLPANDTLNGASPFINEVTSTMFTGEMDGQDCAFLLKIWSEDCFACEIGWVRMRKITKSNYILFSSTWGSVPWGGKTPHLRDYQDPSPSSSKPTWRMTFSEFVFVVILQQPLRQWNPPNFFISRTLFTLAINNLVTPSPSKPYCSQTTRVSTSKHSILRLLLDATEWIFNWLYRHGCLVIFSQRPVPTISLPLLLYKFNSPSVIP